LALNLVAATLHRYPYGEHARLTQHLTPGVCILAGLGLAMLLDRNHWPSRTRNHWTLAVVVLFLVFGCAGIVCDVVLPRKLCYGGWARATVSEIRRREPEALVVICGSPRQLDQVIVWNWIAQGRWVTWDYGVPPVLDESDRVCGFHIGRRPDVACQR